MSIRRQGQITAALGARNLITYRIPFATEIARMVEMKAAGKSRVEIAQRYDIDPKSVNRLLRGSVRSLDAALMQAAEIESTEEVLETSVHGDPDLAWLAGIIEGEGGISPRSVIRVRMTDEDVMQRVAAMLGGRAKECPPGKPHWSPLWDVAVSGGRARGVADRIYETLGDRRRRQVDVMRAARKGTVPASRLARNLEIARRLEAGEKASDLAREYGMTHQNVYYLRKHYKAMAVCPSGEGTARKAGHAGSNPTSASD